MVATMIPSTALLPAVLPTNRLRPSGMPVAELRAGLRRIRNLRNVVAIASTWLQSFGLIFGVGWIIGRTGQWWLWFPTFLLMGRSHAQFGILGHEAAHRLLFSNQTLNDWGGKLLCSFPGFVNQDGYRRVHMAHHRDEFGPNEPDLALYNGYPISRASFWRKLRRDALGNSGYKNLKGLLRSFRSATSRPASVGIAVTQSFLFVVLGITVGWWAWPVLWFGSWMTVWRVINRLRAIAEHGGMRRSADKRETTHHVRQSVVARFVFVPYKVGHHLAHHVDSGIPMWSLPALTAELESAGHITPALTYPSYRALWRALRSG